MDVTESRTAAGVLAEVRELRSVSLAAEAVLLARAAEWADLHPPEEPWMVAGFCDRGLDSGVPPSGEGTPEVSTDCVAELAAALGLSTGAGERLVGQALELRHRLPRLWALVGDGEVAAWQARQVAERTTQLTPEAAAFVDAQVAAMVGRVGLAQLERLIGTATIRFMPEEAERRRLDAQEGRCFAVQHDTSGQWEGMSEVFGRLDLPDAQALDAAIAAGATALRELGCTDSLDVRRARAAGDLARRQPAIDLLTAEGSGPPDAGAAPRTTGAGGATATSAPTRGPATACERVVLYLHLSAEALRTGSGGGQVENTRCPVTAGQIRDWCGRPDASVTVKPVIDLNLDEVVEGYPIPGWMREKVALRDRTCVFPFCSRPAHPYPRRRDEERPDDAAGWSVDTDHVVPYSLGGPTSTDNGAPLCRLHHNLKTHAGWRYTVVGVRSYRWVSPHGYRYLRTPDGASHELGHPDPPPGRAVAGRVTPLSTSVLGVLDRRPPRHRTPRAQLSPPAGQVPAGLPPPVAGEPPPF